MGFTFSGAFEGLAGLESLGSRVVSGSQAWIMMVSMVT